MLSNGLTAIDFFKQTYKSPNRTLADDLKLGYSNEEQILTLLNTYFEDEFVNTKELYGNQYCSYDFEGKKTNLRIELKSRRNRYSQYPTTLIPVHKCMDINMCPNIFVFSFSDGVYYTEWNYNRFKNYKTKMILCKRQDRVDNREHYLIPIEDLMKIDGF